MRYSIPQDLIDTFGVEEIQNLAQSLSGDRINPWHHINNIGFLEKAIEDAEAEINQELAAAFDLKVIFAIYDVSNKKIPSLAHYTKDIARYHLYTTIWLGEKDNAKDHESFRRYTDAIEHIRLAVANKALIDQDGYLIKLKSGSIVVGHRTNTAPVDLCVACGFSLCGCKICA